MTDGPFLDNVIVLSPFIIVQSFCGYLISLNLVDRFPQKLRVSTISIRPEAQRS